MRNIVVVLIFLGLIGSFRTIYVKNHGFDAQKALSEQIAEYNKKLPKQEGNIREDSLTLDDDKVVRLTATALVSSVAESDRPKLTEMLRPAFVKQICGETNFR